MVPLFQEAGAEEMSPLLQSAEVTHIFAEDQEQVDKLLAVLPRCPSVRCIIYDKDRGLRHYKHPQLVAYADLIHTGREIAASKGDGQADGCRRGSRLPAACLDRATPLLLRTATGRWVLHLLPGILRDHFRRHS